MIYKYNILSKHRTELMGLAILWVMFFHSSIDINNSILNMVKRIGYGGVDIFLMLSGLGLYYAYKKNNNIILFYKRRILRILPTYLPVVVVFCVLLYINSTISFETLIMNITTLSFWFNTSYRFDWFIPAIIALYLIAPIILQIFFNKETNKSRYNVISICILIALVLSILIINSEMSYLLIFTSRIPIFCIGIIIGYFSDTKKNISSIHLFVNILLLVIGCVLLIVFIEKFENHLWSYGLWWWPFMFITVPLCIIIGICIDFIKCITELKFINFCGNHSLELYLFHERILSLVSAKFVNLDKITINLVCIIITFIMAFMWKKVISYIFKFNIKKKLGLSTLG